jgi:N-acetylglucosamine kinase-like BadF-type ATPase
MDIFVFGADGGGTKTLGLLSTREGTIVARRTVGASNPNVVGFETATRNLYELISGCCVDAKCELGDLHSIVLGLSGAGREEARKLLREGINALAGQVLPLTIDTDARIGLEGAFDGAPGVVIIAGTGSVVIGKKSSGEILMIGGWGRGLGDEGSGFFLGMEALKSLRLHYDGRGSSALLAELIDKEFGLNSRERIISAVHQEKFECSRVAPLVLKAAEQEDAVAQQILHVGARELAEQARVLVGRLDVSGKINVAFFGGLIESDTVYSKILRTTIAEMIPSSEVRQPARSPAEGAVLMALQQLKRVH